MAPITGDGVGGRFELNDPELLDEADHLADELKSMAGDDVIQAHVAHPADVDRHRGPRPHGPGQPRVDRPTRSVAVPVGKGSARLLEAVRAMDSLGLQHPGYDELPTCRVSSQGAATVDGNELWGARVIGGALAPSSGKVAEGRLAFGRMLAEALRSRQMKQEDLARLLGITQSSVSGWIHGKYEPAAATVFTIEHSMKLEPGSLSRPLGYLPVEPAAHPISVESAITQCASLDDQAKAALASIYRLLATRSEPLAVPYAPRQQPISAPRDRRTSSPLATNRPRSIASGR